MFSEHGLSFCIRATTGPLTEAQAEVLEAGPAVATGSNWKLLQHSTFKVRDSSTVILGGWKRNICFTHVGPGFLQERLCLFTKNVHLITEGSKTIHRLSELKQH